MDTRPNPSFSLPGYFQSFDTRLCLMAHDNYYRCIESQNKPLDKINKFKCINDMYNMETHCHPQAINYSKQKFLNKQITKMTFTKEELEYFNLKGYYQSKASPEDMELINQLGGKY